jgi:UDP-glucose 4-epimerase
MIVVTGASGFVGRAVLSEMARRQLPVVAASRRRIAAEDGVRTVQVAGYSELTPPQAGAVLVHLAEPPDIAQAEGLGEAHFAEMYWTFAGLLDGGWGHVIYGSSAAVYGDEKDYPRRADEPVTPRVAYARAKRACEEAALAAGGAVVRLANLYGLGMAENNVLSDILAQIPGEGPLKVRDTAPVRDYLFIDDAARGLAAAVAARASGVINLGSGRGISVGDLAKLALSLAGEEQRPIVATAPSGRPSSIVLDIGETEAALGWKPQADLEQALARLIASR